MLDFFSMFFSKSWEMLSSINWPGFDFPIAYVFLGVSFGGMVLGVLGRLFNIQLFPISELKYIKYRAGNDKITSKSIAPARRGDVF